MNIKTKLSALAFLLTTQSAGAAVTAFDQYTLELLNAFRADPQAAADAYLSGDLNEGLAAGTINANAKQPLAWNQNIVTAAEGHTADMIANDFFAHQGSDGRSPFDRMNDAGYNFQSAGENLSARGQSGLTSVTTGITEQMNIDLFVDIGVDGRGHRTSMLNNNFESVGISVGFSSAFTFPSATLPANIVTIDFGANSDGAFLTGVAYDDGNLDNFYTPGEGLGGLSVIAYLTGTPTEVGSTTTLAEGGYVLDLGAGTYDLEIGGSLGTLMRQGVVIGNENVKIDYTNNTIAAVPVPAAAWLFASGLLGFIRFSKRQVR